MTNEEIARFFNNARPHIQGNPNLRDPQVEGWFRTRQHFRNSSEHAILQIPVGCGKTGLMALLPFETAQGRATSCCTPSICWNGFTKKPGAIPTARNRKPRAGRSGKTSRPSTTCDGRSRR